MITYDSAYKCNTGSFAGPTYLFNDLYCACFTGSMNFWSDLYNAYLETQGAKPAFDPSARSVVYDLVSEGQISTNQIDIAYPTDCLHHSVVLLCANLNRQIELLDEYIKNKDQQKIDYTIDIIIKLLPRSYKIKRVFCFNRALIEILKTWCNENRDVINSRDDFKYFLKLCEEIIDKEK